MEVLVFKKYPKKSKEGPKKVQKIFVIFKSARLYPGLCDIILF
jgi:hypothetical protein